MARDTKWIPQGVIPAVLLPFNEDLSIDEKSFRAHLADVASVDGLSAITINAHSTEVASCSFDEQKRVLAITRDEIGARLPIVHGVYAEGSLEAARIARMAAEGGASALPGFAPMAPRKVGWEAFACGFWPACCCAPNIGGGAGAAFGETMVLPST